MDSYYYYILLDIIITTLLNTSISLKVFAHWVWILIQSFCMLKNKYDLMLCQSRYTLPPKLSSIIKKDFLRFRIRSKHFDRKGWQIRKNAYNIFRISVQGPLVYFFCISYMPVLSVWMLFAFCDPSFVLSILMSSVPCVSCANDK